MDELLKALTEAIRTGQHLAMPALVGYYIVRLGESVIPSLTLLGTAIVAGRTIIKGMTVYHEKNREIWVARRAAHEAWWQNYTANHNYPT